nr:MAG TPA: hypothetical protein [Caudoviricetes sp.]
MVSALFLFRPRGMALNCIAIRPCGMALNCAAARLLSFRR